MTHRVALLPGDGVGPEVTAEARRAVDALGLALDWTELPWGSALYGESGAMMPPDALDVLRQHDAVLLGAMGDPSVPDDISLWGSILAIRQGLDLWANLRPARLLEGIPCPLAGRGPADVDMLFVRENTEGEYAGVGGRAHRRQPLEVGIETSVFTRAGIERVVRHSFELAAGSAWAADERDQVERVAVRLRALGRDRRGGRRRLPRPRVERVLVDALAARMVRDPGSLDVVVASNLFADILTDLAAAIQGGMGTAASANVAPGTDAPGVFEPVHGSAPDIAGRGVANPVGAIWSAALMLEHLAETSAARRLMEALEKVCREGPRTQDVGGTAGTREVGDAVLAALSG